jgi:DNA-binding NarL/FixJ family response regulator
MTGKDACPASGRLRMSTAPPIRLALIDDYEMVLAGVARMFGQYGDRVVVAEMERGAPATDVDIALFDTFAQREADGGDVATIVAGGHAKRVVIYTWSFDQRLIDSALRQGASGYLAKTLTAASLVEALERIHAGEIVVSEPPPRNRSTVGLDWPGRAEGLSDREAEILALLTQAKSNGEIATVTYLSLNTVKSYLATLYRKLSVRSRTEAALWGIGHGFGIDVHRVDDWR